MMQAFWPCTVFVWLTPFFSSLNGVVAVSEMHDRLSFETYGEWHSSNDRKGSERRNGVAVSE